MTIKTFITEDAVFYTGKAIAMYGYLLKNAGKFVSDVGQQVVYDGERLMLKALHRKNSRLINQCNRIITLEAK